MSQNTDTQKGTSKKSSRKTNDINVKNVDQDIFDYVDSTGIPMTTFARMAMREKMERDKL